MKAYLGLLSILILALLSFSVAPIGISAPKQPAPLTLLLSNSKLGNFDSNALQHSVYSRPSKPVQDRAMQPRTSVAWGPPQSMTTSAGTVESPAAMHPTNPMLALSGANHSPALILNTTD